MGAFAASARTVAGATIVAIAACAGAHSATPQLPAVQQRPISSACMVADSAGPRPATAYIAVQGPLHLSGIRFPQSDGERFVFRQMYETLVRVICEGSVIPGLAT